MALVDVFPDGAANLIQDGILRMSLRAPDRGRQLLEPGRVYEVEIDLWATAYRLGAGHRLRVEVSSSEFDRYDRNLNTAERRGGAARCWSPTRPSSTMRPGRRMSWFPCAPCARKEPMKLSARNRLDGTVVKITRGEAIANVVLDVGGQRIVASITVEAVDELGLKEGSSATAVIKASDVMVAIERGSVSRCCAGGRCRAPSSRHRAPPRAA